MPRFSTLLCCVFLVVVAIPAMLFACDLLGKYFSISHWWFRVPAYVVLIGLMDTLFFVDRVIRAHIAASKD